MNRAVAVPLWLASVLLVAGLAGLNVLLGPLNQDEGVYLYAAGSVWEGRLPFMHFASTQGPVTTLLYALATPLVKAFGLLGGRGFAAALGIAGLAFTGAVAARLSPRGGKGLAAIAAVLLAGASAHQSYFMAIVKTYAPAALLAVAGVWCWLRAMERRGARAAVAAGILLALAAGTRLSLGVWLPVAGLGLLARRTVHGGRPWLAFGVAGMLTLLVVFLPFALLAGPSLKFGLLDYHAMRQGADSLAGLLAYKAGFLSRTARVWLPALAVLVACGVLARGLRARLGLAEAVSGRAGLWAMVLLATAVHFLAPFPYDDYQVVVFPLVAALAGSALARLVARLPLGGEECAGMSAGVGLALFLLCGVGAFASEVNQEWFLAKRDRLWWNLKDKPETLRLREAAREIRRLAGDQPEVLTQDALLAVEAGLRLPRGLELGPFALCPDFDDERAARLKVVNLAGMRRILETSPARVAAATGYSFTIHSPALVPLAPGVQRELADRLRWRAKGDPVVHEDFGQGATRLVITQLGPLG